MERLQHRLLELYSDVSFEPEDQLTAAAHVFVILAIALDARPEELHDFIDEAITAFQEPPDRFRASLKVIQGGLMTRRKRSIN